MINEPLDLDTIKAMNDDYELEAWNEAYKTYNMFWR